MILIQEELRALHTAVQLMVKRTEAKSAAEASLQPASSAMEPIQEGGSEAEGSGSSPAGEEATSEPAQGDADPPQACQLRAPAAVRASITLASVAQSSASSSNNCNPSPSHCRQLCEVLPECQWPLAEAYSGLCVLAGELASCFAMGVTLFLCPTWVHPNAITLLAIMAERACKFLSTCSFIWFYKVLLQCTA